MTSIKNFLLNLLTLTIIALGCSMLFAAAANAQNVATDLGGSALRLSDVKQELTCYTITTNPSRTTCVTQGLHAERWAHEYATDVLKAQPTDLCGREETRGSIRILVTCPDYPALRKLTGSPMFPDEKGQQIFVRSTDPNTKAFRIAMTYRKDGNLDTVVKYSDAHETYDSGAGWVLGDVQIVAVEVTELRETAKATLP